MGITRPILMVSCLMLSCASALPAQQPATAMVTQPATRRVTRMMPPIGGSMGLANPIERRDRADCKRNPRRYAVWNLMMLCCGPSECRRAAETLGAADPPGLEERQEKRLAHSTLPDLLRRDGCLVLPGVYDAISAKMATSAGFDALYMTGYGAVASALGLADAGLATFTEMLDRVRCIAGATALPFIADGDTGYGGLLNVERTVLGYVAAGASGIQLEDQEFPKKCGHTEFRRVIAEDDAVAKIRVAIEARPSREFLIVARTDARYAEGLESALRRAERFLMAGADVLFVESPESLEELRRVAETFRGAILLANMVEGGRTPYLSTKELAALGFKIAIFPVAALLSAAAAMKVCYDHLKQRGTGAGSVAPMLPFAEMNTLMGFPAIHDFEKRYGLADSRSD